MPSLITDEEIKEHKCYLCTWGTWCGTKYKCLFSRCLKGLRPILPKTKKV